jgi:hypothetical protein
VVDVQSVACGPGQSRCFYAAEAVAPGAGVDAGLRCKQLLVWAGVIAAALGHGEGSDNERPRLAAQAVWPLAACAGKQQQWGTEGTRSEKSQKTLMAWGILVEALRNRGLVRANSESKMPRRRIARASRRA